MQLPVTHTDNWDWQLSGTCRNMPTDLFYPAHGLPGHARRASERNAKRICAICPVITTCRDFALRNREPYGVWGGLSAHERAITTHNDPHAPAEP
ncbi:WhiB family transcriptional regulator [Gordonia McavH-238-E]|nr:WhiB family transcriptional regulator [Gordonia sp. McavH-238-E]